jgi:hypothetical protein
MLCHKDTGMQGAEGYPGVLFVGAARTCFFLKMKKSEERCESPIENRGLMKALWRLVKQE